jgi:hypothetical protein
MKSDGRELLIYLHCNASQARGCTVERNLPVVAIVAKGQIKTAVSRNDTTRRQVFYGTIFIQENLYEIKKQSRSH